MRFYADLHIHSKYSRATSRNCDLEHLAWWARRKGITVVATGDFTHPAWWETLNEQLVPAEPGLFRLRPDLEREIDRKLPRACRGPVRFLLEVEISTIYKKGEKTRKVHHLCYAPDFETAGQFRDALGRIGNIASDGRPILGLDSRDLLEITLDSGPGAYLIPAHIWTPWFAAMGSKSGFDSIEDCYGDLAEQIFAVETGLSSDPPMNWRVSSLDKFTLVSNSDAHSPPMLGREACVFETDLDYFAIRRALETREGYGGTMEFFPEEGKYHLDGHRTCGVRLEPAETRKLEGACPSCGKPLTVGVMHRVEALADRPEGERPAATSPFHSLVPLPEIVSEIEGVGPKSKTVERRVSELVTRLGPELDILETLPVESLGRREGSLLREAVERLRAGEVHCEGGFDGEYGVVKLFEPGELDRRKQVATLFSPAELPLAPPVEKPKVAAPPPAPQPVAPTPVVEAAPEPEPVDDSDDEPSPILRRLDPDQRAAARVTEGAALVVAGPGTGKTRTLTHRLAHLVASGVDPRHCLALTFTRRAAEEMAERLTDLDRLLRDEGLPSGAGKILVTTFHGLGLRLVRQHHRELHLPARPRVADDRRRQEIAEELGVARSEVARWLDEVSSYRRAEILGPGDASEPSVAERARAYETALRAEGLVDFDDLLILPLRLFEDPEILEQARWEYRSISLDEYQDIDPLQYRLVRRLAGDGEDKGAQVFAIGDPDQSIYRFRGAEVGFFLRFTEDYGGARTFVLGRNYRSSRPIVDGAVAAIAGASLVEDRQLVAVRSLEPHPIVVHAAASEAAEAEFVAHGIESLIGGTSYFSVDSGRVASGVSQDELSFDDVAVLYRTDTQAGALIEALERTGIPHQKRSHRRLVERPGVRRILAELDADPTSEAQARPLNERVVEAAERAFHNAPDELRGAVVEARELLMHPAAQHGNQGDAFLAALATGQEIDAWDPRAQRVSLLTLHAAKGLEFPVVFLVGCADGLLPLRFGDAPDPEELAEERRLFFVGMTRAQRRLLLSWPRRIRRRGETVESKPSPFLDALPEGLVDRRSESLEALARRKKPRQLRLL